MKKTLKTSLDLTILVGSAFLVAHIIYLIMTETTTKQLTTAGLCCLVLVIVIGIVELMNSFQGPKGA